MAQRSAVPPPPQSQIWSSSSEIPRFISVLVLSAIKLQDEIKLLEELIRRTVDEDKLSGE